MRVVLEMVVVNVVVMVVHMVASGGGGRQPGGLVAGWRRSPEGAEARHGGGGRGASHWDLARTTAASTRALGRAQLGEHGDGVGKVGRRGRSVAWSAHHLVMVTRDVGLLEKGA